ncbi:MAG: hypothetical protein IT372_04375 [Polyangiaceae bacterium]|nr:hypothetical protein [Polyangiaceae bacterium]
MGKNVIVSEDTLRDLLEAHASLSAWYYELWSALRRANASANAPDDAARAAFVERMASDFPEVASVARSIRIPRMFVPPPPGIAAPFSAGGGAAEPAAPAAGEPATAIEPATARVRELSGQQRQSAPGAPPPGQEEPGFGAEGDARRPGAPSAEPGISPPPLVIPSQVKYEP